MIKKILTGLGKLAPSFLHSLDNTLIVQHPLLWSLRLHYVIYYNALVVLVFTVIVYAIPVEPLSAYNLLYISYISLGLSIFSMGLWLYAQNQYNIPKNHGICGAFYNFKYALLIFCILVFFITAAFTPVWLAAQRTYSKLVGEDIINLIHSQPEEAFDDYWDRRIQSYDFFRNLPDIQSVRETVNNSKTHLDSRQRDVEMLEQAFNQAKSEKERTTLYKELGKERALLEESKALLNSHNQYFRVLYDSYLLEDRSNLRSENLSESTGKKISFQGKTYTQHRLLMDSYNYSKRLFYRDPAGNPYFLNDLVNMAFIDRLVHLALPEINAGLQQVVDGEVILSDKQLNKFTDIYSIITRPPGFYTLLAEFAHEELGGLTLLSLIFPSLLIIMLVTTTANLFGTKAFFVDTTSSLAFCIFILTLILVADNSYDIDDEDFVIFISIVVFGLSLVANIFLRKCTRRRKAATFFWQISTFCIPVSLFFGLLLFMNEHTNVSIKNENAFAVLLGICVLSLMVLFPLQFRLAHKLFALPR